MKVLIAFFSYTGNTRKVAESLARVLKRKADVDLEEIQPTRCYPYFYWLILSFIPRIGVSIKPPKNDPRRYDMIFLGLPKWTFSCPPINQYLREVHLKGKGVGIFITYGGFDERRYLKQMVKHLGKKGATVKATLLLKRDWIKEGKIEEHLRSFCSSLI